MKNIFITFTLLCGLFFSQNCVAQPTSIATLFAQMKGDFITTDRPDDYRAILQWRNRQISVPEFGDFVLYHERSAIKSTDKPYNQQVWVLENQGDQIRVRHYEFPKTIASQIPTISDETILQNFILKNQNELIPINDIDLFLRKNENRFEDSRKMKSPNYFSRFVKTAEIAQVDIRFEDDQIYYHLQLFDTDGKQVYGSKERGYILSRK